MFGVLWNIEDHAFGFKVTLKSKPLTRRGVLPLLSLVYDPLGFGAGRFHRCCMGQSEANFLLKIYMCQIKKNIF